MRTSVRMAVVSALSAMAVFGASAAAAGADDHNGKRLLNVCSNDRQDVAAESVGSGDIAEGERSTERKSVVCQIGRENSVVNYHKRDVHYYEGDVIGRDATAPLAEAVSAAAPRVRFGL